MLLLVEKYFFSSSLDQFEGDVVSELEGITANLTSHVSPIDLTLIHL